MFYSHRRPSRQGSLDSINSSASCQSNEAVNYKTTAAVDEFHHHHQHQHQGAVPNGVPPMRDAFLHRSRQSSTCSERSCEGMSADETVGLWICMLELQERYGCYNSTRINLAVNAGDDAVRLMPNRFIIDTLNHSLVDLPEEGWEMLNKYLRHDDHAAAQPKQQPKQSHRRLWK